MTFTGAESHLDDLLAKEWSTTVAQLLADVTRMRESRERAIDALEKALTDGDDAPTELFEYVGLLSRRGLRTLRWTLQERN